MKTVDELREQARTIVAGKAAQENRPIGPDEVEDVTRRLIHSHEIENVDFSGRAGEERNDSSSPQ